MDTFAPTDEWTATTVLATDLDAATGHDVVLTVRGEHNQLSSASWVQLAAVQLTVHRA